MHLARATSADACQQWSDSTASPSSTASWPSRRPSTSAGPRSTRSPRRSGSTAWSSAPSWPRPRRRGRLITPSPACSDCWGCGSPEACRIDIEHLGAERGHRTVTVLGKGAKLAVIPLPPRVGRALDLAAGERLSGPVLLSRSGKRLDRHGATRIVRRVARRAGITKHISPHSLRHSFITAALDAGVPLRDVQIAARHADPRTTTRYDRARNNLDRHASYVVAAFVAGAS